MSDSGVGVEKICFVIGPIGGEKTETRLRSDKVFNDIIGPATSKCGYKAIRADMIPEPGIITNQVIQHLLDDPLVIADLTERNPNVYYELAARHSTRKPTIQIIFSQEELPFDISAMRTIRIDLKDSDSIKRGIDEIRGQITSFAKSREQMANPISIVKDLTSLKAGQTTQRYPSEITADLDDKAFGDQLSKLDEEAIVDRIKSRGYWLYIVRPLKFERTKFTSANECRKLVESCIIQEWGPYPYYEPGGIHLRVDGAGAGYSINDFIGYWRMFQSGQFVFFAALQEDWYRDFGQVPEWVRSSKSERVLDFIKVVSDLTHFYECAARIDERSPFREKLDVTIELHRMTERKLVSSSPARPLGREFVCRDDPLSLPHSFSAGDILREKYELALNDCCSIFEAFDWPSPDKNNLREIQRNLWWLKGREEASKSEDGKE